MDVILVWIVILLLIVFILLKRCKYSSFFRRVRRKGYNELLSDSRWRRKREKILERDNHCCQWCHSRYNLQVHHKAYHKFPNGQKVDPWDYPDRLLITLCNECHKKWHEKYKVHTFYRKWGEHYL